MTDDRHTQISRRRIVQGFGALGLAVPLAGADLLTPLPARANTGFYVEGTTLYDANGAPFVMRGINHPHEWFPDETESFAEISELGANTVRVVLGSGDLFGRTSRRRVADAVEKCKANDLVCMLEVHDTTGYPEQDGAITLAEAVRYWRPLRQLLRGNEEYVLINIGNEPYGNPPGETVDGWVRDTEDAIVEMRSAGFNHTLVVDAPNWGQDWTNTMSRFGGDVLSADPLGNTMLSVHMYEVYSDPATIEPYLVIFVDNGWPLLIGEFGWKYSGELIDAGAIMTAAEQRGLGYIGWSYSGNSGGVEYLDLVEDFDPNRVTDWGRTLLDHPAGIRATAERASVYDG